MYYGTPYICFEENLMAFIDALVKHEPAGEQTDIFWEVKEDRARTLCIHYLSTVQKFFDSTPQSGLIQLKFTDDHPAIYVDESNQFLCIIGYKPDQGSSYLALRCPLFVFLVFMVDCAFAAKLVSPSGVCVSFRRNVKVLILIACFDLHHRHREIFIQARDASLIFNSEFFCHTAKRTYDRICSVILHIINGNGILYISQKPVNTHLQLYDYYPDVLKAIRGEKQMQGLQQTFFNNIMTRFREYPSKLLFDLAANGKKEYDLDDVIERTLVGYLVEKMSTEQINHLYFVDNGVYRDLAVWIIRQRLQQQEDAMRGKSFIDKEGLRGAPSEPLCISEFANFPFTAHSSLNMPK